MHDYCKSCAHEAVCDHKDDPEESCGWHEKLSPKGDGGPAFPIPNSDLPGSYHPSAGMTLRDWFAGMAIGSVDRISNEDICTRAYAIADKMLEVRDVK